MPAIFHGVIDLFDGQLFLQHYQVIEKIVFLRLVKNIQRQGVRNPEE
jgi:hypothetical protein